MTYIISFIIVLGILIFVHEFGHFIIAKKSGVGVLKFSLGFGPRVIGKKIGETEYQISAIPLGGYVKIIGENPEEEVSEEERGKSFSEKSIRTRMAIIGFGPLMNLFLAFILFCLLALIGFKIPAFMEAPPRVGWIVPDSPAQSAGLREGDLIMRVNDRKVGNWEDLKFILASNPNARLRLIVEREGILVAKELVPEERGLFGVGYAGLQPELPPIINEIVKGDPADLGGLKKGDVILAIDGEEMRHWLQMAMTIWNNHDKNLRFKVKRGQEILFFSIRPKAFKAKEKTIGLIGISPLMDTIFKRYGTFRAIVWGGLETLKLTNRTITVLWRLLTGRISLRTLGGPISIFQMAGTAAKTGIRDFMFFMAGLSVTLAIINIFPIPLLDGGHLLFLGIEGVRRKPISMRSRELAYRVGLVIIVLLMLIVFYTDMERFDIIHYIFRKISTMIHLLLKQG
ncbi:MAG: RIP metalloprotease RseP [Syntrophobacterales bacterium]|nr:MAG: RIP metalloprotease RseP [Syntrophobacterales bacterium]